MNNFYGDRNRFFLGVVVNNDDTTLKLGRVQVRIFGIHDNWEEVPNWALPWAQVVLPTTEAGTNGIGANPMLEIGTQVFGFFLDGSDSQMPLVLGSIPRILTPTSYQQSSFTNCSAAVPPATAASNNTSVNAETASSIPQGSLAGSTNAEKAFNFFIMNGFTPQQSAGIVGNFARESYPAIIPTTENSGGAYGIAQWLGSRKVGLQNYARAINQPISLLETQLGWVIEEFKGHPDSNESAAAAQIKATQTVAAAAAAVKVYYERNGEDDTAIRIEFAEEVYERFA
jgi:hypothetical protein